MIAVPNQNMVKYTSATIDSNSTYNRFKMFLELRRDEDSPFTIQEMLDTFSICRSGRSFVSRPGDIIVLISRLPDNKSAYSRLMVRKACGLYGLVTFVSGMVLEDEKLMGDYERTYYVINPQKDAKLLRALANMRIMVEQVGVVTREGHSILFANGDIEEVIAEEQGEKTASVPTNSDFAEGYIKGFVSAFEGSEPEVDGNPATALGVFSSYFDIQADVRFFYRGASKSDGLFLFPVSFPHCLPNRRSRAVFKLIKKGMKNGNVSGCIVFNDGDLDKAVSRISNGECAGDYNKQVSEGVWCVLLASRAPIRGGTYLGRLHSLF